MERILTDIDAGFVHALLKFGGERHQFRGVKPQLGLPLREESRDLVPLELLRLA